MIKKPELLAPAGDFEKLQTACIYGADAVYLSGKNFGLRASAKNFGYEELKKAVDYAHGFAGKRINVYVTVNIFAHNSDFIELPDYLRYLEEIGADAVIVSDLGVFSVAQRELKNTQIHISTQANTTNYVSAKFWAELGASRIVLARELSLGEIREINGNLTDAQTEAFVHGAMCMSYSGRCLISNFLTGRDANRGACAQPCRWEYEPFYIKETSREGEFFPMYEDGRGTYLFNSKDLCMISHIPELAQSGLSSFKIEGRMKTPYYIAATLKAYRAAIDDYFTCPEDYERNKGKYLAEIGKTSNRVFTTGFYFGKPEQIYESSSYERSYDFAGVVRSYDEETKIAEIEQRNKFSVGDTIEVLSPEGGIDGGFAQTITEMRNEKGAVADAPHPKELIYIKMEKPVSENYFLRKKSN